MLRLQNKKRFDIAVRIKIVALAILLSAALYLLVITHYQTESQSTETTSSTIENIATTGTVIRDNSQPTVSTKKKLIAQPTESVQYTADPVPVKTTANAAVFNWEQSSSEGVLIEVRTQDNGTWSDWREVEALDGGKDGTEATSAGSALVLADNIDQFQFRVNLEGSATQSSAEIDLTDSALVGIDSSDGPTGEPTPLEQLGSFLSPGAAATVNAPNVISRAAWGAPEPYSSSWKPAYATLKQAVVHHTATTESSNAYADMRAIWHYHARSLGWGDIGYHYVVDSKGRIFEGRYQDKAYARASGKEVIGGHAYGHNEGTIGVSAIGDYRYKRLSSATRDSIARIIGYKLASVNINPASKNAVVGHYKLTPTSCPGANIITQLPTIRSTGTRQFSHYRPLFSFTPLGTIRWMDTSTTAYKYDPVTGEKTSGPFPLGRRIDFADTITSNGVEYYRTTTDATRDRQQAFKASELTPVTPIPFTYPRYMELTRRTSKINPITYEATVGPAHPAGIVVKFVDKVTIRGTTYFRSEHDSTKDRLAFFASTDVKDIAFEEFLKPRHMRTTSETNLVNPITGEVLPELSPVGQDALYTQKVYVNGWYYQSIADSESDTPRAIPASSVEEIRLATLPKPMYIRPIDTTYKYNLHTLSKIETALPKERYPQIKVVAEMTIDGQRYYQTYVDATRNRHNGIPANEVEEVEAIEHKQPDYTPMVHPRALKLRTNSFKVRPSDGKELTRQFKKGTTVRFATKTTVDGVLYLRTSHDTTAGIDRAFRFSDLQSIR